MITIISGTNRPNSNSIKVANTYKKILEDKGYSASLLNLTELTSLARNAEFEQLEANYLTPAQKFIVVAPEYNGSLPGALKLLIDTSRPNLAWYFKKIALVGVSTGRAGNLRGLDHATAIFNHMKAEVLPNKLPISTVDKLIGPSNLIEDEGTLNIINLQIDEFINY